MAAQSLDFSDKTLFTGPQPAFSPDKKYVALAQEFRLVLRDVENMAVVSLWSCLDRISSLAWSPSGEHILCGLHSRGTVQVFSVADAEWTCSISEGLAGVAAVRWCPSGQQVLITADFKIKLSVWSLVDQSCHVLQPPKHEEAGVAFSADGSMLAVLERAQCKDSLTVYDAASWQKLSHTALPMVDSADLAWSPDSTCLAVWEGAAHGYVVSVYTPSGECLATHRGRGEGLGAKCVAWSPSGQLLAVGSYEQEAAVLNHVTWSPLAHFNHPFAVAGPASVIAYREEVEKPPAKVLTAFNGGSGAEGKAGKPPPLTIPAAPAAPGSRGTSPAKPSSTRSDGSARGSPAKPNPSSALGVQGKGREASLRSSADWSLLRQMMDPADGDDGEESEAQRSRYVIADLPLRLPASRPPVDKPNPRMGVSLAAWSPDGAFLATRCDAAPQVAWVWDSAKLELAAVLVHAGAVRALAWDPVGAACEEGDEGEQQQQGKSAGRQRLAVVAGAGRLHLWTPAGASCVRVPVPGFKAQGLKWNADGTVLLMTGRDAFCCAYFGGGGGRGGGGLAGGPW